MLSHFLLIAHSTPSLYTYFSQSDFAGKLIFIILIVFSLIAWTLMIGKHLELKHLQGLNAFIENQFTNNRISLFQTENSASTHPSSPFKFLIQVIHETHAQYLAFINNTPAVNHNLLLSHIENALERAIAKESLNYESKMTLLGTIVSGAPFLGLLGTVWGVMDAFGGMALQSSASLQSLAPGISGALLTTIAGLLVAIPAVFGYNYLLSKTKKMIIELENFASLLSDNIEIQLSLQASWQKNSAEKKV